MSANIQLLPDGRRLHCNHGPIDLIIEAFGEEQEIRAAYAAVRQRFPSVLQELVSELELLRKDCSVTTPAGAIARSMHAAVEPFATQRITPMAAVAGAVADHMIQTMRGAATLRRAYVNNGGDIAIHLSPHEAFSAASPAGRILVTAADSIAGIATSGWKGRSFSLGIADSVTVLARTAAEADAAATMIANAIDLPGSPKITRLPANSIQPDSDLRERLVTIAVAPLTAPETATALQRGVDYAQTLLSQNLIDAAILMLNGTVASVSPTERKSIHA